MRAPNDTRTMKRKRPVARWLLLVAPCVALLSSDARSQSMPVLITLEGPSSPVPEHLPIQIRIVLENVSVHAVELQPYDLSRLPEAVSDIRFESRYCRPVVRSGSVNAELPLTRIAAGHKLVLVGYLQDYLTALPAGRHVIPYRIDWHYSFPESPAAPGSVVHASGTVTLTVVPAALTAIQEYLDRRIAVIQTSVEIEPVHQAAREIVLVDHPAALAAGPVLLKAGLEEEALTLSKGFGTPAANRLLEQLIGPSVDPAIIQESAALLGQRHVPVSVEAVGGLLGSSNSETQTIGLQMVAGESFRVLAKSVEALTGSPDPAVQKAAREALRRIR